MIKEKLRVLEIEKEAYTYFIQLLLYPINDYQRHDRTLLKIKLAAVKRSLEKLQPKLIDFRRAVFFLDTIISNMADPYRKTRKRPNLQARQLFYFFSKQYTCISLQEMADEFSQDHATALHGYNTIFNLYYHAKDKCINASVTLIKHLHQANEDLLLNEKGGGARVEPPKELHEIGNEFIPVLTGG